MWNSYEEQLEMECDIQKRACNYCLSVKYRVCAKQPNCPTLLPLTCAPEMLPSSVEERQFHISVIMPCIINTRIIFLNR